MLCLTLVLFRSLNESATLGVLLVLSNSEEHYFALKQTPPFHSVQLLEILRIQMPQTLSFLTRMIFYVRLIPDLDNFACCSAGNSIAWFTTKEIVEGAVENIWGPDIVQYSRVVSSQFEDFSERIEEFR